MEINKSFRICFFQLNLKMYEKKLTCQKFIFKQVFNRLQESDCLNNITINGGRETRNEFKRMNHHRADEPTMFNDDPEKMKMTILINVPTPSRCGCFDETEVVTFVVFRTSALADCSLAASSAWTFSRCLVSSPTTACNVESTAFTA